jgi:hypothetical protein
MSNNLADTFSELRAFIDGNDPFMTGGHQIIKLREVHRRPLPWMLNATTTAAFLLKRFPFLKRPCGNGVADVNRRYCSCRPCRHNSTAGLWMFVIQICFLMSEPAVEAARLWNLSHPCEHHIKDAAVRRVIQMIFQANEGLRLDGKPRSFGKAGRPKKSACTLRTSMGSLSSCDANRE